ncbi:GTP-binding protein [Oxynema sp. CENA135]|uniref:CobW family GTP-binding protein n=1 Tax=Oxynema sp. CENA135 TaxID=984206 RepID=UPI00190B288B|nr:GTP-binding protein [Oxynema sp. CENA135]MBK4730358.1 GTP-binding protein [Oxynema sp. CENA135]
MDDPNKKVLWVPKRGMPITIITGFLGSGKTTLLNHILSNNKNLKIAVLVNEFGDINIDSQLLVSIDENMLELSNGCICCTINDGLVDAVYRILERSDRIDYMVIETTGVADPLPIILTFLGTELRDFTRLDAIVTMVDAESFTPDCFDSEAALKQIAYADITILNKTDLATPEKVESLEAYIRTIKEGARILHSQHGNVPLPLILDVGHNQQETYDELLGEGDRPTHSDNDRQDPKDRHHHHHHDHHDHHDHRHSSHLDNDGFVSISFESDRPFEVKKFETFLQERLPQNVFRAKGIIWFQESELANIFQLSGPRFDLQTEQWKTSPKNQLVFIGRDLNREQIRQQLTDCLTRTPSLQ